MKHHCCSIFPSISFCHFLLSSQTDTVVAIYSCYLLLSCSFTAYPTSKPPTPTWWSQWRKSMLVTGRLLELKLTTLGKLSDNLDVGVVVFKSSGLLFVNASELPLVFSECLNMRRVWLNCPPHYWCRYFCRSLIIPLRELAESTFQSQSKQWKSLCKGMFWCPLRLVSVAGTKSKLNQFPRLSRMFYHEELFLFRSRLLGSTVCSCWTRTDATVCSLSTANCFCLVSLPKHLARTHFSCFASTRGHAQRECETELLVESFFFFFWCCCGNWIFLLPISTILASWRKEQERSSSSP